MDGEAEGPGVTQPPTDWHWMHALTIPRQLEWKDGQLLQKPVEELMLLRGNEVSFQDVELANQEIQLSEFNGTVFELLVNIKEWNTNDFSIKIGQNNVIFYRQDTATFTFQRANFEEKNKAGNRHCIVPALHKIQAFKDASCIEIFVNEGAEVFTSRVFDDSTNMSISFLIDFLLYMLN